MKDTIVFVYNADGGLFNTLSNIVHKIFSPETYRCKLCSITYSVLGMKKEYKAFINSIGRPLEFLHHDELKKRYHISNISLPAVFSKKNGKLRLIIESGLIEDCQDLSDLKRLIREKISMWQVYRGNTSKIKDDEDESIDAYKKYFMDMDLIINEGFKREEKPKIEILRATRNSRPFCGDDDNLIALVTDTDTTLDVPTFGLEDIEALANLIEERYLSTATEN